MAVSESRYDDAMGAFEAARGLAEEFDMYAAAWLTAACAEPLLAHYPDRIRSAVQRYAGQVGALGFADLIRKYQVLQGLDTQAVSRVT
jgi:hypothetical protein